LRFFPLKLPARNASGGQKLTFAFGEASTLYAFYREVFPKAQQELRTPNALRDKSFLVDNIFSKMSLLLSKRL
jgi:hypothetical protein